MDPRYEGQQLGNVSKEAASLLRAGRHAEAVHLLRQLCDETHFADQEYDPLARSLAQALTALGRKREAFYVQLYLRDFAAARVLLAAEEVFDEACLLEQQGALAQAGERYEAVQRYLLAAIAYERGEQATRARACWERALGDPRLRDNRYVQSLVFFNLGYCCLQQQDDVGHAHLVTAQHLLEEVADEFETRGQRERAFDCYQLLLEIGRRSGVFENLAEGYLNCIRILKEDSLKYYVLQYYEDFLGEATRREEYHAAASLYREAADYCLRVGLIYHPHYLKAAAQTWMRVAEKNQREQGPVELAENAYLAAVACFNTLGAYDQVGEAYRQLCSLALPTHSRERYSRIAARYDSCVPQEEEAPPFPSYLRKPHAYPEIWYMDLVEWEHDGDVVAVCGAVVGDPSYPDVVRRRALAVLLDSLEPGAERGDPAQLARIAERLGDMQIYVVLRPLERLFEHPHPRVQRGVMQALRFLFFKRSFGLLTSGLASADEGVRAAAIEALGRLYFTHAFDPLVRIFREYNEPRIKTTALESIGRIPSLEAGDFLIEVLRYEPEPLHGTAKRLLIAFENRELIPILRQHLQLESGPLRAELAAILKQMSPSA